MSSNSSKLGGKNSLLSHTDYFHRDWAYRKLKNKVFMFISMMIFFVFIYLSCYSKEFSDKLLYLVSTGMLVNFITIFYDHSQKAIISSQNGIRELKTDHIQIYGFELRYDREAHSLSHQQKREQEDLQEKNPKKALEDINTLLFQNLSHPKTIGTFGIRLTQTAMHIKPNFQDFLRRLSILNNLISGSVQISFSNGYDFESLKFFSPSDRTSALIKQPKQCVRSELMSYSIFISRTLEKITKASIAEMLIKLNQAYFEIMNLLTINFAHYHFDLISGRDLLNRATLGINTEQTATLTTINSVMQKKIQKKSLAKLYYLKKTIFGNICNILIMMMVYKFTQNRFILYVILVFSIGLFFFLLKRFLTFNLFSLLNNAKYIELNPFNHQKLLIHQTKGIQQYNTQTMEQTFVSQYTFSNLNRNFRFNPVKFYRSLMYSFLNSDKLQGIEISAYFQFFFQRILPTKLDNFKMLFDAKHFQHIQENPGILPQVGRKYCGFYQFQPIITLKFRFSQDEYNFSDSHKQILNKANNLQEQFLMILNNSFPQCNPCIIDAQHLFQSITKSRDYFQIGSGLPVHLCTGVELAEYITIPEEIHKSLPNNYPGEFSTPFLKDEIIMGSTFNPENNRMETYGGINTSELSSNLLLTGENSKHLLDLIESISSSFLQHGIRMLIFDWNGDFRIENSTLLKNDNIQWLEPGKNCALKLFELPFEDLPHRDIIYTMYIQKIISIFGQVFPWNDLEIANLRASWMKSIQMFGKQSITPISLDDIIREFNTDENRPEQVSILTSHLHLWNQNHLKSILDEELFPITLLNSENSIIVNLGMIVDPQIKSLFIQVFLTQFLFANTKIIDNQRNFSNIEPLMVMIPEIDLLFPEHKNINQETNSAQMILDLIEQQCPIIAYSSNIGNLHSKVLDRFENIMVHQMRNQNNLKRIASSLNIDYQFTNIQQKSHRKASYQIEYIRNLPLNQVIFYRKAIQQPFPFTINSTICKMEDNCTDQIDSTTQDKFENSLKNIPLKPQRIHNIQVEVSEMANGLETIFPNQPNTQQTVVDLLNYMQIRLEALDFIPDEELERQLNSILQKKKQPRNPFEFEKLKIQSKNIIEKLEKYKIIQQICHETTSDYLNYQIGRKGLEILERQKQIKRLLLKPKEDSYFQGNSHQSNFLENQFDENEEDEIVDELQSLIDNSDPDAQEDGIKPIIPEEDDFDETHLFEYQTIVRKILPELIIYTKIDLMQENIERTLESLIDGLNAVECSLQRIHEAYQDRPEFPRKTNLTILLGKINILSLKIKEFRIKTQQKSSSQEEPYPSFQQELKNGMELGLMDFEDFLITQD